MSTVSFEDYVTGLALDTIGGSEKVPVIEGASTPRHVTPDSLKDYAIAQLVATAVITPTAGDAFLVERAGTAGTMDLDALSGYVTTKSFDSGAVTPVATDLILVERGGTLGTSTLTALTTLVNDGILDFSSLAGATPSGSDVFAFTAGSDGRKITFTDLQTELWSAFATYVAALTENTSIAASDKFYCVQGGTPKWVDITELDAYFDVGSDVASAPATTTENQVPQWDSTNKLLKDGLAVLTTVRATGSTDDTSIATEGAVRDAIDASAANVALTSIDIDGGTDIGAALADADLFIVDDGAGGTNRKAAMSRIFDYVEDKIQGLSAKVTPVGADIFTVQDSADSNSLKELTLTNLIAAVLDIDGMAAHGGTLVDADLIIVDDGGGGTNRSATMEQVWEYANSVKVATYSADQTLTTAECYGYVIYVEGAATITLPAVADGMNVTIITIGAVAVSIDPNASDKIWLDGTALDDGDKITNGSSAGDIAVLTYKSADGWHAATNSWTDGGA